MLNTIVNKNLISFKKLEQKIYSYVCELAREITQQMLESYNKELAESRDKKRYRGKGKRSTTIKTVYGEVEYCRNVYRTETQEGQTVHVYLLDQAMHMDKIGLISTNLAEKIALTVTESPYRVTAEQISSTCGQNYYRFNIFFTLLPHLNSLQYNIMLDMIKNIGTATPHIIC